MSIEQILTDLNIKLPPMPKPMGSYVPYVKTGNLIFVAGQGPRVNGINIYTGKVGAEVTLSEGYEAAKLCAVNMLAILQEAAGSLENITRIVSVRGYVNSTDDFYEQPAVINGASELLVKIFGEKGQHARCAVSANALPMNISVEVELVAVFK